MEKVNFYHHYVKVKLKGGKSNEQKKDARTQLLARLLLNNKICLSEINQKLRINNSSLYITALRTQRDTGNISDYVTTLGVLYNDICHCKDEVQKGYLKKLYINYNINQS